MTFPLSSLYAFVATGDPRPGVVISNDTGTALVASKRTQSGNIATFSAAGIRARIDSTGKGFFNGGTQTGGADFAESVEALDGEEGYEPGDVLVIDTTANRRVALAQEPYSPLVAGVYSTKPGVLGTTHPMNDKRLAEEIPMAMAGIVPTKVSAENGLIRRGDLLVTAATPGHAMKGRAPARMLGAIVGKALEPLREGTGIIEVLVTLQ